MIVFRYDKSFDGLMTAVFDAYARRRFPELLLGPDEAGPLFADEVYQVATDPERSARVWEGLGRKLDRRHRNMLLYVWLSEVEGSDMLLLGLIRKIFDNSYPVLQNFADPDVDAAHKLAKKVSKERHRIMQFVRFQKASDDTFFAAIEPDHNALPLAVSYFTDRFRMQKWIVYDLKRNYGYFYDLKTVEEITLLDGQMWKEGKLDASIMAGDEKLFQTLWRSYFKHTTIQERINPKLHRQNMPRRYWKHLIEKQ